MSTKPRKKSTPMARAPEAPIPAPALPAPIATGIPPMESEIVGVFRDASSLAKENLAVFTAVNSALSEGMTRIGLELAGIARGTLEDGAGTAAALLDARTIADVAALNGDFARACVDRLVAGAMRLSELVFETASEVYEPFGARLERAFSAPPRPLRA